MISWSRKLKLDYAAQVKSYYCGPATMQMVLSSAKIPSTSIPMQQTLYGSAEIWQGPLCFVNPLGLACTLNRFAAPPFEGQFDVFSSDLPYLAAVHIIDAIYADRSASAALVLPIMHWVTVFGAQTDIEPKAGAPYVIEALWLYDPASGTANGAAEEHVTYASWLYDTFTGAYAFPDPFVVVSAIERQPGSSRPPAPPSRRTQLAAPLANRMDPQGAIEGARRGIARYGLQDDFADASPREPYLVQRIDRSFDFYFLVPFDHGDGTSSVARVDASTGAYLGARLRQAGYRFHAFEDVLPALRDTSTDDIDFSSPGLTIHRTLVWRPSRESPSPYDPFYRLYTGVSEAYVDRNLRIHPCLTSESCG